MKSFSLAAVLGSALASLTLALAGCPAGSPTGGGAGPGGGGAGGGGGAKEGGMGDETSLFDQTEEPVCEPHCSSDLHQVLDCTDHLLLTCPADQGCAGGGCVPACESANANKSTIGCDYYSLVPDTTYSAGACYAVFIANTWTTPITVQVGRGAEVFDLGGFARLPSGSGQSLTYEPLPGGQIPPGKVAMLFLNAFKAGHPYAPDCPAGVTPAVISKDAAAHGTSLGEAFHIVTSAPAVAYDIFPFGGGVSAITSATLLLPTSAWDLNYLAIDGYPKAQYPGTESQPWVAVVARESNTTVTILPKAEILSSSDVNGTPAGVPRSYVLSKGQVLQITQDSELNGSPIEADKAIGFWGGQTCMDIEVEDYACDSAHQQIPPIKALGSEYVAVRYRDRLDGMPESPPFRLLGVVDGTKLSYDPAPPKGAPLTLNSGELVKFTSSSPFVVKSQDDEHPIYFSAHMTGGGAFGHRGDPEFVNVIPPQQWLSSYLFFTDPTYPETNLVFVRAKGPSGFEEVTLDCAGKLGGWQPVGDGGLYQFTRVDLVRHDFMKQGACDNGTHIAQSAARFGLTIWGWGSPESAPFLSTDVSYAYPAGAGVRSINDVAVLPIPK